MKQKNIRIFLTPEDMDGKYISQYDCPIARACKRHFGADFIAVFPDIVYLDFDDSYDIIGGFYRADYDYVKDHYKKIGDTDFYITLKPNS